MPAPKGYWSFVADPQTGIINNNTPEIRMGNAFPNPANALTAIPVETNRPVDIRISMHNITGKKIKVIAGEHQKPGKSHYFIHAGNYAPGTYIIKLESDHFVDHQKLIIH